MSRIVRSSKYRHIFGTAAKREVCYDNLKPSKSAWDSNKVCINGTYIGLIWEARGGGSFAVVPKATTGKFPSNIPLICGHKNSVLDIDTSPFNDSLFASVSEDGYGKIWSIPDGGITENVSEPVQSLVGHRRKVGTVRFNPCAENVVATSSADFTVKIWDVSTGEAKNTISGHSDIIQCCEWDFFGKTLATTSKDKKVRIIDPRADKIVGEIDAHPGIKGCRVRFLGDKDKLITIGFSKTSDRQYAIWDPRNLGTKLASQNVDTASGILIPHYDNDTGVLFLAGKGDGNVRYYEIVDDKPFIHFLSEFKSSTPQLGMGMGPKTSVDVSSCEIAKLYKVCNGYVEPISFTVPRKSDIFQDDIYPNTRGGVASNDANGWFSGKDSEPAKVSLEGGYVAPPPKEFKPEAVKEVDTGPKTEAELRKEYEKLKTRVSYLEAEIVKKDQQIKELSG